MYFVGYSAETKGYHFYDPPISRYVLFDEKYGWQWSNTKEMQGYSEFLVDDFFPNHEEVDDGPPSPQSPLSPSPPTSSSTPSSSSSTPPTSPDSSTPSQKWGSLQDIYARTEVCQFSLAHGPSSFAEAVEVPEWCAAIDNEIQALKKHDTWELVDLPNGKTVIGLKWVYKLKYKPDGLIQKHKARLVARGYMQREGIDFEETFAPVARFETIRTVLVIAAYYSWNIYHFDVKSVFLNGVLDEEVFVEQPIGYVVNGQDHKVCKLKKALYGLKQAPRAWYSRIDNRFSKFGLQKSASEPTLYVKAQGPTEVLIVYLYVDDLIYTSNYVVLLEDFKKLMIQEFEMTDLGLMSYFLGLEVKQNDAGILLSQEKYLNDLLKKFQMQECNPVKIPLSTNQKFCADDGEDKADAHVFRSLVGSLLCLTHSRPDIMYATS
ncbi:hypothetical protein Scep_019156 [Stephania cephalantha]|uniref:Reverse transcriptase Ty1/copia-type domain-containing protein n=1 Tax=Stephania cephalantha TaxID=152367 RepID=A0AAP0NL12_9MAGN